MKIKCSQPNTCDAIHSPLKFNQRLLTAGVFLAKLRNKQHKCPTKIYGNWCTRNCSLSLFGMNVYCFRFFFFKARNRNTMKMERSPIDRPPLLLLFNKLTVVWLFNSVWLCRLSSSWQQLFFRSFVLVFVRSFVHAKLFTWLKELFVSSAFVMHYTLSRHYLSAIHILFLAVSFLCCLVYVWRTLNVCMHISTALTYIDMCMHAMHVCVFTPRAFSSLI